MMTLTQQVQHLNTMPSGQTGTWHIEKDGTGVFYVWGKRR